MPAEMPSHFPQRVVAYLVDFCQVPLPEIINAVSLPPEAMLRADILLETDLYPALVRFAIERTGNPAVGIGYGRSLQLSDLGLLGYAAGAQPTVADGIELFVRYYDGMSRVSRLAVEKGNGYFLRVLLEPELAEYMVWFLSEAIISAILQNMERFRVPVASGVNAHFAYPRPAHARCYDELGVACHFDCDATGIYVPPGLLTLPLGNDSLASQWPDSLELNNQSGSRAALQNSLESRLGSIVRSSLPTVPTLSGVAQHLGMSPRKLQRQLQEQGLGFRSLVSDIRVQEAATRLQETRLSVRRIAEQTGFADSASFTRAFKRYFEVTPGQYREGEYQR